MSNEIPTIETTETATTTAKVTRTPFERVSAGLEQAKKFFIVQEEKYSLNPKRVQLIKIINERLKDLTVTEERANEIAAEAEKFAGSRSVKWTNDLLEYANPKVYAGSELRDKVAAMNPSVERLVYELVLKVVESWEDVAVALPCPFYNCMCNTHVKTERSDDGLFHTGCNNPKHMSIKTQLGKETANESVEEWNKMVQNN